MTYPTRKRVVDEPSRFVSLVDDSVTHNVTNPTMTLPAKRSLAYSSTDNAGDLGCGVGYYT